MRWLVCCTLLVLAVGIAAPAQSAKVLGDITLPREGGISTQSMPEAVFPHWKHRLHYTCYTCHDKLFKMQLGADHITMDALRGGQYCAQCHNGKTAFEVGFETCDHCHIAPRGSQQK